MQACQNNGNKHSKKKSERGQLNDCHVYVCAPLKPGCLMWCRLNAVHIKRNYACVRPWETRYRGVQLSIVYFSLRLQMDRVFIGKTNEISRRKSRTKPSKIPCRRPSH